MNTNSTFPALSGVNGTYPSVGREDNILDLGYPVEEWCDGELPAAGSFYDYDKHPVLMLYDLCGGDPALVDEIRGTESGPLVPPEPAASSNIVDPPEMPGEEVLRYVLLPSNAGSIPYDAADPPAR